MNKTYIENTINALKGNKIWNTQYKDFYDLLENGFMQIKELSYMHKALINLCLTSDIVNIKANQFLKKYDLSIPQKNVLEALYYSKHPITQVHLSNFIFTSKSNLSTLLNRMEKKELIKRYENPDNKREKLVKITKSGINKLNEIFYSSLFVEKSFEVLTEKEAKQLNILLFKLKKNFCKMMVNDK